MGFFSAVLSGYDHEKNKFNARAHCRQPAFKCL